MGRERHTAVFTGTGSDVHHTPDPVDAIEIIEVLDAIEPRRAQHHGLAPTKVNELIGQVVGSYVIKSVLGQGGSGTIYLAEHRVIGTKVAVKVLLPEVTLLPGMAERFLDEARASSELGSPHLPRYYDLGTLPSGQPYAILELLEGETLAHRIETAGPLPIVTAVSIASQVAGALALAHDAGIVHRDVKPENLFLTHINEPGPPFVKVLDFGIAKRMGPGERAGQTGLGVFLGSPAYCAPEQALGQPVGPEADVYALGVTLFVMLTGHPPFDGEVTEILNAKTTKDAPYIEAFRPELPDKLAKLIDEMVERSPLRRPQSMHEVRTRLDGCAELLAGISTQVNPTPVPRPVSPVLYARRLTTDPTAKTMQTLLPGHSPRRAWGSVAAMSTLVVVVLAALAANVGAKRASATPTPSAQPVATPEPALSPQPVAPSVPEVMPARMVPPGALPVAEAVPEHAGDRVEETTPEVPALAPAEDTVRDEPAPRKQRSSTKPQRTRRHRAHKAGGDVVIVNPF
jgi:serine/threonine protein kinase